MRCRSAGVVLALLLGWPVCRGDEPKAGASKILLDDFEGEPQGWTYVGGWEFPGAKGELVIDNEDRSPGQAIVHAPGRFPRRRRVRRHLRATWRRSRAGISGRCACGSRR